MRECMHGSALAIHNVDCISFCGFGPAKPMLHLRVLHGLTEWSACTIMFELASFVCEQCFAFQGNIMFEKGMYVPRKSQVCVIETKSCFG